MIIFFKRLGSGFLNHWLALTLLVLALLMGGGLALFLIPRQLVIAAGQGDFDEPRVVQLLMETLAKEHANVRLTPLWTNGASESAEALASGKADIAVTRSDLELIAGATSLASLRKFYPVVFTNQASRIKKVVDLRGKRIGIGGAGEQNVKLAKQVLAHWGLKDGDYQFVRLKRGEQVESVRLGSIDAFFAVSSGRTRAPTALSDNVRKAWGNKVIVIMFEDAAALAQSIRGVEAGEIVKGFYGGEPAKPDEDTESITVSNRLVANANLSPNHAVTITKALLSMRDTRQADTPEVLAVEEPARNIPTLPVHPGTLQLIEGQYQDFLDRYTNHIFILAALLGGLGSSFTVFNARRRRVSRNQSLGDLHHLLALSDEITVKDDPQQVQKHLQEVDDVLRRTLIACASGQVTSGTLTAIQSAVNRCHRAADSKLAYTSSSAVQAVKTGLDQPVLSGLRSNDANAIPTSATLATNTAPPGQPMA